jgi:hypothetical protein
VGDNPDIELAKSFLENVLEASEELGVLQRILHIHDDADISVLITDFLMSPFTKDWLWDKSQGFRNVPQYRVE